MEKDKYPLFTQCLVSQGIPEPQRGYKIIVPGWIRYYGFFGLPKNHWRIDYVWPHEMLAVQIDGGAFKKKRGGAGAHTRGSGFRRDMIQHNLLTSLGFNYFIFMPEMLPCDGKNTSESTYAIDTICNFFAVNATIRI